MVRRWPDTLPGTSFPGFDLSPIDQSRRSDMEIGDRVRRISFARFDRTRQSFKMTDVEFAAFRDWHEDAQVSLAGDSDSLAAWTRSNLTLAEDATLSPDGIAADRLLETATNGSHFCRLNLPGAAYDNVTLMFRASIRAAGRTAGRLVLFDRAGTARTVVFDLTTGALSSPSGIISSAAERRGDYWRFTITASTGIGALDPAARIECKDALGAGSYAGNPALGLDICEVQARLPGRHDLFIPSDADGKARGAAGGSSWFQLPVAIGNGLTVAEAQFTKMYTATAGRGLNWVVAAEVMVRNA